MDRSWQTFERLSERGVCPSYAFSLDLTLFIVGHDKQQVTGVGDVNVIVASLVDTVRRPGDIEGDLDTGKHWNTADSTLLSR